MNNFIFNNAASICLERGGAKHLSRYIDQLNCRRVLFITDSGVLHAGLAESALTDLHSSGINVKLFTEVQADPPAQVIYDAVKFAVDFDADCVVGFGGGSSMDVAKLVALVAKTGCKLDDIFGVNVAKGERLKLILVPTTSGTGSEVTPISIVTTGESEKKGVVSPILLPDIALLDAELTIGLPRHITAATGVDAMVHAIEAYTGRVHKNPISDCLATESIKLLSRSIQIACNDGKNIKAREDMLLGACLAGMAFANSPVGAVHALAYPVGARHHVPHGLSNSLVLPHVAIFNHHAAKEYYSDIYSAIFPASPFDESSKSLALIDYLKTLGPSLGLPGKLSEVGISKKDIPILAEDAMKQTRLLVNNPREVTLKDALSIYEEAF